LALFQKNAIFEKGYLRKQFIKYFDKPKIKKKKPLPQKPQLIKKKIDYWNKNPFSSLNIKEKV